MIHVQVKKSDIRKGRLVAGKTCGCPIWHALRRSLRALVDVDDSLNVPRAEFATYKQFKLLLPQEAQDFQYALMDDFSAPVEPFEFEADVVLRGRR